MKKQLFREVIIWFEVSEKQLIRYRLFQDLSNGKFFAKSAENVQDEFDAKIERQQYAYFVDSLFYNGITEFGKESFDTIEEAISAFEAGFE